MAEVFLGIDLGGTNIKIGCFDSKGNLLAKASVTTGVKNGADFVIQNMIKASAKLLADNNIAADSLTAIGIGSPGPLNCTTGVIIDAANLGLRNVPLRQIISNALGAPAVLENDANAACWGEYVRGAGKGADNMIFFTLGTGIGGAVISDGKLIHGISDNAAELGHIVIHPGGRDCSCGQKGCAEAYASASSTARRATEAIHTGKAESSLEKVLKETGAITCRNVYEHAAAGDELATEITEVTAKTLALLCVNVFHTVEPARAVFAGGMIAAGDILLDRIKHFFDEYIWKLKDEPFEICFATLGEDAGIIGAAALAMQAHGKN